MKKLLLAMGLASLLAVPSANAIITWDLGYEFSNGDTPSGPITVTLEQQGVNVRLTVSAISMTGSKEFIDSLFLNYDGAVPSIVAGSFAATPAGSVDAPTLSTANPLQADGDGVFDFKLLFTTDNNSTGRFQAGESISLLFGGATESKFDILSVTGQNKTGLFAAAHVQGIGLDGTGSGWVTVPEPTTMIAGALLLLPFAASTVRFMRKNRKA